MSTKNILLSLAVIGILVAVLIFVVGKKMFAPSKGTWFVAYPEATDNMTKIPMNHTNSSSGTCHVVLLRLIRSGIS